MSSDCNNPDVIFYSVFSCSNASQVFEGDLKPGIKKEKLFLKPSIHFASEREYQCLGQWEEDGLLYAYTRRRDLGEAFECFVGKAGGSGNDEIFLMEGGAQCRRGLRVEEFGMRLTKQSENRPHAGHIIFKLSHNTVNNTLKAMKQISNKSYLLVSFPGSCNLSLPSSGPWFIPVVREVDKAAGDIRLGGDAYVPGLNVIREEDIEDLSTKPWMPMTGGKSCSRIFCSYSQLSFLAGNSTASSLKHPFFKSLLVLPVILNLSTHLLC